MKEPITAYKLKDHTIIWVMSETPRGVETELEAIDAHISVLELRRAEIIGQMEKGSPRVTFTPTPLSMEITHDRKGVQRVHRVR